MENLDELNSYLKRNSDFSHIDVYQKNIEKLDQGSIIELLSMNCYYEESRNGRRGEVSIADIRLKKKK